MSQNSNASVHYKNSLESLVEDINSLQLAGNFYQVLVSPWQ